MRYSSILLSLSFVAIFYLTADIYSSKLDDQIQVDSSWRQYQENFQKHVLVMAMFNDIEHITRELISAIKAEDSFEIDEIAQNISLLRSDFIKQNIDLHSKNLDKQEQEYLGSIENVTRQGRQYQIKFMETLLASIEDGRELNKKDQLINFLINLVSNLLTN